MGLFLDRGFLRHPRLTIAIATQFVDHYVAEWALRLSPRSGK